jgi:hypothetical protein
VFLIMHHPSKKLKQEDLTSYFKFNSPPVKKITNIVQVDQVPLVDVSVDVDNGVEECKRTEAPTPTVVDEIQPNNASSSTELALIPPTLRYPFDPLFLVAFPWLPHDAQLTQTMGKDTFICLYCSTYPQKCKGGSNSKWVCGWSGGFDGYRRTTLEMHDNNISHNDCRKTYDKEHNIQLPPQEQATELTPEAILMQQWRAQLSNRF